MATKQDVSFGNPTAIIAPDLAVAQEQLARKQQLIDALKSQGLQPIDGGRGGISWTQGLAKLLGTYAATRMQKANDAQSVALNRQYADRMGSLFGMQPRFASADPSQPAPQAAPMAAPAPDASQQSAFNQAFSPDAMSAIQGGQTPPPVQPASAPPQAAPSPQPPMAAGQPMPAQQSAQPGYAMSLSGNPQQDMMDYFMNPGAYSEAMIKNHSPVAPAQMMQQAQAALARGDTASASAILGQMNKDQYIAPINVRQGGAVLDPITRKPIFENPQLPPGASVTWDANGRPTQVSMVPGAETAIAGAAGAKTAGENRYEPIAGYDAAGNPVFGNKLDAANGGSSNFRPNAPLGAPAAADVQGKASAEIYQRINDNAAGAPDRIFALHQIDNLASNPNIVLGPGSDAVNKFTGVLGTLGQKVGITPPQSVTNAGEFNKWTAQYGARTAESLGLSGSDARFNVAVHASPNGQMTPQAIKSVLPTFIGWEVAAKDRGAMAQNFQQRYGLQSANQFQTHWAQNYDPRIYTWMAQGGVPEVRRQVSRLPATERANLLRKYDGMKALGATFSE